MKYIKYIIIVIFLAATITYVINWAYTKSHTNESAPVISVDNAGQVKKVSVKDKDALLKGVVAKDSKDGDITSRLVVESISKFVDKKNHICNITYAVANSRGVVTKATRKIQFTDYKKPRFVCRSPCALTQVQMLMLSRLLEQLMCSTVTLAEK